MSSIDATAPSGRLARVSERLSASPSLLALVAIGVVGFVAVDVTFLFARLAGVPARLWFSDTLVVLVVFGTFFFTVACLWDGALLAFGLGRSLLAWTGSLAAAPPWWRAWRRRGFFSIGWWPPVAIVITIYFLLGTSNITQISLSLLQGTTGWQDAFYWSIEGELLAGIMQLPIHVVFWETIYNSGWQAEMLALFAILVVTRCPARGAAFCVSFILLFYVGRLLGLLSPVMGPAFFAPEHFAHLDGSITSWMMEKVEATMAAGPRAGDRGAVLLGGVAAMPSLHVGMISLASYWLARSLPWATPLVLLWLASVWASTVLLGWHYVLDGLGGILTAAFCIWLTGRILEAMNVRPLAAARA